jgi:hypothetical protein
MTRLELRPCRLFVSEIVDRWRKIRQLAEGARHVLPAGSERRDARPLFLREPIILCESVVSEHVGVGVHCVEERIVVAAQLPLEEPFRQRLLVRLHPLAGFVRELLQPFENAADSVPSTS